MEKFGSELIIGGNIEQIVRMPGPIRNNSSDETYLIWDVRVPLGRNFMGHIMENIFFVQIRGKALNAVTDIYAYDYVKIKPTLYAQGIMGADERLLTFFYKHWNGDRVQLVIDDPSQILEHEPMKVSE